MLNPILYTNDIVKDFLKYQLTAYPFADENLYNQMRSLLNLEQTRRTPLFKGPYVSLSRGFRQGSALSDLVAENIFHPHLENIAEYPSLYGHQEKAVRAISQGKTTLISTGTGSGKTECFLYPIISHCLQLKDDHAPAGIAAIIVYPMNALAEDQLGRLRKLLAGQGITFGMYVGKTPEKTADAPGKRLKNGSSSQDYKEAFKKAQHRQTNQTIYPPEEKISREEMRESPPRILLTNVKQLELLLTRQRDTELFNQVQLQYLVFDEAHTVSGAAGAETACLIRRLRSFCDRAIDETTCIATSATIADPNTGQEAGREFVARFFGVKRDNIELVGEQYEADNWAEQRITPPPLPGKPNVQLNNVLNTLEQAQQENNDHNGTGTPVQRVFQAITGEAINAQKWQESLYDHLAANELVYQLSESLKQPRLLSDLIQDLQQRLQRQISEEELLIWLALGAASRKDGRPLLRPVIHGFIRGVGGAVVTFPNNTPQLWLSAEDISASGQDHLFHLPVSTCTTCGQHYFVHHVADFKFSERDKAPQGGQALGTRQHWEPLSEERGGNRVILLDRLITQDETDHVLDHPKNTAPVYYCRQCGTLHSSPQQRAKDKDSDRCDNCGALGDLVVLLAVHQKEKHAGKLTSCVACQASGRQSLGRYREPIRDIRATTVSDVHVLSQNLIHHAERQRLLVFADNRQDAAFQAGWMQDHARRYRLRSLMYEHIQRGSISIGDLTAYLDELLDNNDELSRSLIPEVWDVARKERAGVEHNQQRKRFLRIQILREITTGVKQRIGLEPWGRLRIDYVGLTPELPFIQKWSQFTGIDPQELTDGIAALLDLIRRSGCLLDQEGRIFSRRWTEGDFEIQRGYLPLLQGVPVGLKLQRDNSDHEQRVKQWLTERGETNALQAPKKWGMPKEVIPDFLQELWQLLTEDLKLLANTKLTGKRNVLQGCHDVYQLDADSLRLSPHQGVYRCQVCRRSHLRPTPKLKCMAWHCNGTLEYEAENSDDYDLMVLDQQFSMLRPREHSAQVPAKDREVIESIFKGDNEQINTLVCTPTLEMGVDIGNLDTILMRNVPPLPSNYWQRAGRAGREHRMAVNFTYARQASHDRAYFQEPLKLLQGEIKPPRFNLRNRLMIEKHVHATVLTILYQLMRNSDLSERDREDIEQVLNDCFPTQVKAYLFDENELVRQEPLSVTALDDLIKKHETTICKQVQQVFHQDPELENIISDDDLQTIVLKTGEKLNQVIDRLWKRLQWALNQLERLDQLRQAKGTLDADEEANRKRCDRLVRKLKGKQFRKRQEAEGYDDINTYSVLASEGFLPGYGLETGSVRATAQVPYYLTKISDFELPRPSAMALREYVPGNLIYANNHRFIPRFYHLEPQQQINRFQVDLTQEAISEVGVQNNQATGLGGRTLPAVPICDVDLPHQSHITDDEIYRFQLPVTVMGYEQERHNGGKQYAWGTKTVQLRRNVHFRLVNVGVASLVNNGTLGYPLCTVCGQSRSPLSSIPDQEKFREDHLERCGQSVQDIGFYADVVADALRIQDCANREEAYSIAEALRFGASRVLEMELEDLQLLAIAQSGVETVDILIYDPMPGGSGLLEQMVEHWEDITSQALAVVQDCPSLCETACIDCLFTYRNAYYHRYLNRHLAQEKISYWGHQLNFSHEIPAQLPDTEASSGEQPVNAAETMLRDMLLRAGFPTPNAQYPIDLGKPLGVTTPDFFYEVDSDSVDGLCIYLDGMSQHLHGNPETQQRDRAITDELESLGYEVFRIPAGDLHDRDAMAKHFFRIGRFLVGKEQARQLRQQPNWFDGQGE